MSECGLQPIGITGVLPQDPTQRTQVRDQWIDAIDSDVATIDDLINLVALHNDVVGIANQIIQYIGFKSHDLGRINDEQREEIPQWIMESSDLESRLEDGLLSRNERTATVDQLRTFLIESLGALGGRRNDLLGTSATDANASIANGSQPYWEVGGFDAAIRALQSDIERTGLELQGRIAQVRSGLQLPQTAGLIDRASTSCPGEGDRLTIDALSAVRGVLQSAKEALIRDRNSGGSGRLVGMPQSLNDLIARFRARDIDSRHLDSETLTRATDLVALDGIPVGNSGAVYRPIVQIGGEVGGSLAETSEMGVPDVTSFGVNTSLHPLNFEVPLGASDSYSLSIDPYYTSSGEVAGDEGAYYTSRLGMTLALNSLGQQGGFRGLIDGGVIFLDNPEQPTQEFPDGTLGYAQLVLGGDIRNRFSIYARGLVASGDLHYAAGAAPRNYTRAAGTLEVRYTQPDWLTAYMGAGIATEGTQYFYTVPGENGDEHYGSPELVWTRSVPVFAGARMQFDRLALGLEVSANIPLGDIMDLNHLDLSATLFTRWQFSDAWALLAEIQYRHLGLGNLEGHQVFGRAGLEAIVARVGQYRYPITVGGVVEAGAEQYGLDVSDGFRFGGNGQLYVRFGANPNRNALSRRNILAGGRGSSIDIHQTRLMAADLSADRAGVYESPELHAEITDTPGLGTTTMLRQLRDAWDNNELNWNYTLDQADEPAERYTRPAGTYGLGSVAAISFEGDNAVSNDELAVIAASRNFVISEERVGPSDNRQQIAVDLPRNADSEVLPNLFAALEMYYEDHLMVRDSAMSEAAAYYFGTDARAAERFATYLEEELRGGVIGRAVMSLMSYLNGRRITSFTAVNTSEVDVLERVYTRIIDDLETPAQTPVDGGPGADAGPDAG